MSIEQEREKNQGTQTIKVQVKGTTLKPDPEPQSNLEKEKLAREQAPVKPETIEQKKHIESRVKATKTESKERARVTKIKQTLASGKVQAVTTGPPKATDKEIISSLGIGPTDIHSIKNLSATVDVLYKEANFKAPSDLKADIKKYGSLSAAKAHSKPTMKEAVARLGLCILEPIIGGVEESTFYMLHDDLAKNRDSTQSLRILGALATPTPADMAFSKLLDKTKDLLKAKGVVLKAGTVEIPLSNGGVAKWKGTYVAAGSRSKLLTGKLKLYDDAGKLITKIDDALQIQPAKGATRGYVPQTDVDVGLTKELMSMLKYTEKEFDKIDNVVKVMQSTQNTKSKFISDVLPKETNTLSADGVKAFIDFAKKNQDDVEKIYGSFAVKNQLNPDYNFGLPGGIQSGRKAGDIDVLIKGSADDAAKVINRIYDDLLAAGENVRIDPNNSLMIQAKVNNKWAHAIDGHATGEINLDALYAQEWGFKTDKPGVTIEGILTQSAGEQSVKKGGSILGFLEDGTLGPVPHRGKDVVDFVHVSQTLEDSKSWWSKSVQREIDNIKDLYGVVTIDDLDNIYAKLQKTEFVFKKSGAISSLSPAAFYGSLGIPFSSLYGASSLAGGSPSPSPSPEPSPPSPPSPKPTDTDEPSPPSPPPDKPDEPSPPPSPPDKPDEPSPPPSTTPPLKLSPEDEKKRREMSLSLYRGRVMLYRVNYQYRGDKRETIGPMEARSFSDALGKAQRQRRPNKTLPRVIVVDLIGERKQ